MTHLAYCLAVYRLGSRYHNGQWSRGYELMCLASERIRREHSALNAGEWWDKPRDLRKRITRPEFIKELAFWMKVLRKHRNGF